MGDLAGDSPLLVRAVRPEKFHLIGEGEKQDGALDEFARRSFSGLSWKGVA